MSSEPTRRDEALRRMLVETSAGASIRPLRRRTLVAGLAAFVAAGVLTGGAVSAAAPSFAPPAPPSSVDVEQMASELVYDDTTLFGTPVKGATAARVGIAVELRYAIDAIPGSDDPRFTVTPLVFVGATFADELAR